MPNHKGYCCIYGIKTRLAVIHNCCVLLWPHSALVCESEIGMQAECGLKYFNGHYYY